MKRVARVAWLGALWCAGALGQGASLERPFSDQSPWNARPTKVVLGTDEVPKSDYFPNIAEGAYSVRVFAARDSDPPMTVLGPADKPGIYLADNEETASQVVIPHWPAAVAAATGEDGHADIVDVAANRIHSFWQLGRKDGKWRASQYTWTRLDGRGWGDPAQYFQGSRAAGVPTMAGLIRTHELNDGQPEYQHALAMSMTFNALAADPAYVFPATAADVNAAKVNRGTFPEGALVMLPTDFDTTAIRNPALLKIATTLKTRGAYVVDANVGTPYILYVEIGSGFSLMPNGWDNQIAGELDRIRAALRRVVSVGQWLDAKGRPFTPRRNLNLLSMRGPWSSSDGGPVGRFESWEQRVVFPTADRKITQTNASGRSMPPITWAVPKPGASYRLQVTADGGATLRLDLVDAANRNVYSSGTLGNAGTVAFKWPAGGSKPVVSVTSGAQGGGRVGATLVAVDDAP